MRKGHLNTNNIYAQSRCCEIECTCIGHQFRCVEKMGMVKTKIQIHTFFCLLCSYIIFTTCNINILYYMQNQFKICINEILTCTLSTKWFWVYTQIISIKRNRSLLMTSLMIFTKHHYWQYWWKPHLINHLHNKIANLNKKNIYILHHLEKDGEKNKYLPHISISVGKCLPLQLQIHCLTPPFKSNNGRSPSHLLSTCGIIYVYFLQDFGMVIYFC